MSEGQGWQGARGHFSQRWAWPEHVNMLIEGGKGSRTSHPLYPLLCPPKMQALREDQRRACVCRLPEAPLLANTEVES